MNKTRIEWVRNPDGTAGYSWNPIKGICPVGCWYCYAKKIYKRFDMVSELSLDCYCLNYGWPRKPSHIFVCSTMEIFHPDIPNIWREKIFDRISEHTEQTFIILTKMPERIDRPMLPNVWLGVSVTGEKNDDDRIRFLCNGAKARVKFVSFEPLLGDVAMKGWNAFPGYAADLSWVIVGKLTGHGHKFDPSQADLKRIYSECREAGLPIFFKNNLRDIWKGPFVQEFPMEICT